MKHTKNIDEICWCNICENYRQEYYGAKAARECRGWFLTGLSIVGTIILIDIAGFTLWKVSGTVPPDGFFIGALTNFII